MRKILIALAFYFAVTLAPYTATAASNPNSACTDDAGYTAKSKYLDHTSHLQNFIDQQFSDNFDKQEDWIEKFWDDNILKSLKGMADELAATAMYQAYMVGTFFDAKTQLETQQSLQKIRARAHKDYQPSTGMCKFGSVAKSLAASERKGELNALTLQRRVQDRNLGNASAISSISVSDDRNSRVEQFKKIYCNPADNNGGMKIACTHDSGIGGSDPNRLNKDIDYTRIIDAPWTLDIDFSDASTKDDEVDVIALSDHLYGSAIIGPIAALYKQDVSADARPLYLKARSLLAKRSVAQNSFNEIVALKSAGTDGAKDYIAGVIKELGLSDTAQIDHMIGDKPSYYAQMEVLTKKLYQTPDFYTNLYDKPANIRRKEVAMQAIALMQKFDLFKSYLRSEASLAVLLETALAEEQGSIEGE